MDERKNVMSDGGERTILLDESPEAILFVDYQNTIIYCNTVAEKLFSIEKKELTGTKFNDFIENKTISINLKKLLENVNEKKISTQAVDIELINLGKPERYKFYTGLGDDFFPGSLRITIKKIERFHLKESTSAKVDLMYMTHISSQLSAMKTEDEVFDFIGEKLKELFPRTILLINRSNPEGTWLRLEKVFGIQDLLLYKLVSAIGFNPIGRCFKVTDAFKLQYSRPKLFTHPGSLFEFCNNEIPEPVTQLIEKSLKLKAIHTIGIADQGEFFGFIHFFSTSKSETINIPLLESLIYLCYLSISRVKSVHELEEREKQYKLLADNVKDVIFTLDLNLNYTYISPSIKRSRGYEPSELIGISVLNSLAPQSYDFISTIFKEEFEKFKTGKEKDTIERLFEVELVHRNGTSIWSEIKASFIYDKDNKPSGILGVSREINERKMAEKELLDKNSELNDANIQKDKFFSIIAHDLKSPFGHILNFSSLLKEHYHLYSEDKRKQFIDLINKSSQQIYLLLENLLDWSRSQGGKMDFFPQSIRLDKLISDVMELLNNAAASKNITLSKTISLQSTITADEYMLKTIIRNLIGNSIKFTADGGRVHIEAKEENKRIEISVTDTGVGMNPDLINLLFNLEHNITKTGTKGEKGTGLGLLLCKEFVEMHGGKIWVNSKPGEGSTFAFSIPMDQPKSKVIPKFRSIS